MKHLHSDRIGFAVCGVQVDPAAAFQRGSHPKAAEVCTACLDVEKAAAEGDAINARMARNLRR